MTEAPLAWEKLMNFQASLEGTYHKEMIYALGAQGVNRNLEGKFKDSHSRKTCSREDVNWNLKGEFKCVNGNKYLHYELTNVNGNSYQTAFCLNARYGFALDRTASSSSWEVGFFETRKNRILDRLGRQGAVLHMDCTIDGQSLLWMVKQSGFQLKNARTFEKEGKELVEIHFATNSYLFDDNRILGGRVVLDASNFWAVQEYEVQGKAEAEDTDDTRKGRVEYAGHLDGFPLPKRSVIDYNVGAGYSCQQTITLDVLRKCVAPDSDFTLAAFGLPEISEPSESEQR